VTVVQIVIHKTCNMFRTSSCYDHTQTLVNYG